MSSVKSSRGLLDKVVAENKGAFDNIVSVNADLLVVD